MERERARPKAIGCNTRTHLHIHTLSFSTPLKTCSHLANILPEKRSERSMHAMQLVISVDSPLADESILRLLSLQFCLLCVNPVGWYSTVDLHHVYCF